MNTKNGTMMLPAEKRLWVVECKSVTCVKAGEMVE